MKLKRNLFAGLGARDVAFFLEIEVVLIRQTNETMETNHMRVDDNTQDGPISVAAFVVCAVAACVKKLGCSDVELSCKFVHQNSTEIIKTRYLHSTTSSY